MSLINFKELLLRKTAGTPLEPIIKYMGEEQLSGFIMESLEKMAQNPNVKGKDANYMVRDFASKAHADTTGHMMRDALSHHVSHYKKNLASGNKEDAHAHAKQAQKIMNLAAMSQLHSNGNISLDHVDFHPWERQQFAKRKTDSAGNPVGSGKNSKDDYVRNTKGLNLSSTNHKDYSFLEGSPHWSHGHKAEMQTHRGSYPWEDVKLSGKHLHINDVEPQEGGFKNNQHAFDKHPIMDYYNNHYNFKDTSFANPEQADVAAENLSNQKREDKMNYDKQLGQWRQEHLPAWLDQQEQAQKENPDDYSKRGLNKPEKVLQALQDHDPEKHGDYESIDDAHRQFRLPKDYIPSHEKDRAKEAQAQREQDAGVKTMDASGNEIKAEPKAKKEASPSGKEIDVNGHKISSMDELANLIAEDKINMDDIKPEHHDVMNSWGKK